MTPFAEAEALRHDISKTFGETPWRLLGNKFVKAAKAHTCNNCLEPVQYRERHRVVRGLLDGTLVMLRFCDECCAAMVRGDGEFDDRWKGKKQ